MHFIYGALRGLVLFAQFKKHEKHPWERDQAFYKPIFKITVQLFLTLFYLWWCDKGFQYYFSLVDNFR